MKRLYIYLMLLLTLGLVVGCSDFLDPELDGSMTEDEVFENAAYFSGVLHEVYNSLPNQYDYMMDCATDNAVTNDYSSNYLKMGTGFLRPNMNPLDDWKFNFQQIRRINQFLEKMVLDPSKPYLTPVRFRPLGTPADSLDNINTFYRFLGEAYFLRAYCQADLLKKFGGEGVNGEMLGFPIVTTVLDVTDDLNLPRNTYMECVEQIINDCDSAIKYLPVEYTGNNAVLGSIMNGRANGIAAMALKARVLLYAASPLYNPEKNQSRWEEAAIAAGDAIAAIGGMTNLETVDNYYFVRLNNRNYQTRDIFFRGNILSNNRAYENANYPPSMYGNGRVNPSQNFVDAFPDSRGYPIDQSDQYNPTDPYKDRDPRLALFVAYNNSRMGPNNYQLIETYEGGKDAFNPARNTSRSGYYLKKLLRYSAVQLIPGFLSSTTRAAIYLGTPELYLNFAEAAFEAWGPEDDPRGYGWTAKNVIERIHQRYGSSNVYLNNEAVSDNDLFRELIRNERRLELSFEGHYFFDVRRWIENEDITPLNTTVKGAVISKENDATFTYDLDVDLEKREFISPFMPIPYSEIYNAPALIQNKGWE